MTLESDEKFNLMIDVIIPCVILAILFLLNGILLFCIYLKRKTIAYDDNAFDGIASSSSIMRKNAAASGRVVEASRDNEILGKCDAYSTDGIVAERTAVVASTSIHKMGHGIGNGLEIDETNGPSTSNSGISFIRTCTTTSTSSSTTPPTTIHTETEENTIEMERL